MCGILGAIPAIDPSRFQTALDRLAHRGPDAEGTWLHPQHILELGHRRLAIIDLKPEAAQPMCAVGLTITFNGEIYNYRELRAELGSLGHRFTTDSDTEVLLLAYKQWGAGCLNKLRGMWAFAIWDEANQQLFMARDRFGEKPLFYTQLGNRFVFGSEMKALMALGDSWQPNPKLQKMVGQYDRYASSEDTLIAGIKHFPAGHYGYYKNGKLTLHRYWDTLEHLVSVPDGFMHQAEMFRERFANAVGLALRADVPVGAAISGGLDSAAVLGAAATFHGADRLSQAFTAVSPGSRVDESQYAKALAQDKGVPLQEVVLSPDTALQNLADDLYYFEEIYRTPPSPMMALYRQYRADSVYVSVDGHGPDEMFSGYGNFLLLAMVDAGLNPKDWKGILQTYEGQQPDAGIVEARKAGNHQYLLMQAYRLKEQWLDEKLPQAINDEKQHQEAIKRMGYFNYALYRLFHYTILPTLLRNYDRYSMRSGVEIRMPFLDPDVVAMAFSVPWQSKIKDGYSKALLREAAKPWLPGSIVQRKDKVGFQAPLADWLRGPWKNYLQDTIHSQGYKDSIANKLNAHQKLEALWANPTATNQQAEEAWLALSPYLWEEYFYKRAARPLWHTNLP